MTTVVAWYLCFRIKVPSPLPLPGLPICVQPSPNPLCMFKALNPPLAVVCSKTWTPGDGGGPGGVEDPPVHLQLEECQGLLHPPRQAAGGRRARPAGGKETFYRSDANVA